MIAISYRREDSSPVTGRLFDRLQSEFGRRNVFMDFDSIPFGVDFRDKIKITLERARVVVAVVGPNWMGNRDGKRRIDDPRDFVRIEIAAALERGIPVIPVLLDDTKMPDPEALPEELRPFAFRNALVLDTGVDFHHHASRLISGIQEILHGRPLRKRRRWTIALTVSLGVGLGLVAGGVWWSMMARRNVQAIATTQSGPAPPAATQATTPGVPRPSETTATSRAATAITATPFQTTSPSATAWQTPITPVPAPPQSTIPPASTVPPAQTSKLRQDIAAPSGFQRAATLIPETPQMIANQRFRSADGTAQFAITAIRVSELPPTVEARMIALPISVGEKVTERTPTRDSGLYHEDITVEGPNRSYTRYFAIDVSLSRSSDATTRLWEFWVRDERALQSYREIYRAFKKSAKF